MTGQIPGRPVAVIAGASSGFGEQVVRNLADEGWLTIGLARREGLLYDLAAEAGGEYQVCDIADADQVRAAAGEILSRHPAIHLLVQSAGMPMRKRFEDADDQEVADVMMTNYLGPILLTNALLPGLEAAAPSDIINIVSAAGAIVNPSSGPYAAAKHAQGAYSRSITGSLGKRGIRVHAIHPGKADTEGHPQKPTNAVMTKLTRTDVGTVAKLVVERVGQPAGEVYVPGFLRVIAGLDALLPTRVTATVERLVS